MNFYIGDKMREIDSKHITDAVARMCIEANRNLPRDVRNCIECAHGCEPWPIAQDILGKIIDNYKIAEEDEMAICQDTGLACVFIEIGQEVYVKGSIEDAVNEGVRRGYTEGYLRKSCVAEPLGERKNTLDNTPAMIYYDIKPGDELKITVAPKGFGSENMSRLAMLKVSDGVEGVKKFVLETVEMAGPNPCPPIVVGVGIGGTFDKAALLAKKAAIRPLDERNPKKYYADMEEELLERVNALGIGPQGFGGETTALAVNIETMPTHIAGLPVAVNINCHVARHMTEVL